MNPYTISHFVEGMLSLLLLIIKRWINKEQSPIDDDFINDEPKQLESSCEEGLEGIQYLDLDW